MSDALDPKALERARVAFTVHLRKADAFDERVGNCPIDLFRAAMDDAIRAYLAALPTDGLAARLVEVADFLARAGDSETERLLREAASALYVAER